MPTNRNTTFPSSGVQPSPMFGQSGLFGAALASGSSRGGAGSLPGEAGFAAAGSASGQGSDAPTQAGVFGGADSASRQGSAALEPSAFGTTAAALIASRQDGPGLLESALAGSAASRQGSGAVSGSAFGTDPPLLSSRKYSHPPKSSVFASAAGPAASRQASADARTSVFGTAAPASRPAPGTARDTTTEAAATSRQGSDSLLPGGFAMAGSPSASRQGSLAVPSSLSGPPPAFGASGAAASHQVPAAFGSSQSSPFGKGGLTGNTFAPSASSASNPFASRQAAAQVRLDGCLVELSVLSQGLSS